MHHETTASKLLWLEADVVIAKNPWPMLLQQPASTLQAPFIARLMALIDAIAHTESRETM
ncbi:MAG: hypothetical protein SGPRY_010253 [Prymnesium sp.]